MTEIGTAVTPVAASGTQPVIRDDKKKGKPALAAAPGITPFEGVADNPLVMDYWHPHIIDRIIDTVCYPKTWLDAKRKYPTPPSVRPLFKAHINNIDGEMGVRADYVMGYMKWYDGWGYLPFPKLFLDLCYENGRKPILTWEPSFNAKHVTFDSNGNFQVYTFLEELNKDLQDSGSDAYGYVEYFARQCRSYGKPIILRPFHEMNIDYGYDWTGFMNGGGSDRVSRIKVVKWVYKNGRKQPIYALLSRDELKRSGNKDNGIPDGPERLIEAWLRMRAIFGIEKAINVEMAFCYEALSQPNTPWNTLESYWPGDDNAELAGFDVYQKKTDQTFEGIFSPVTEFLDRHGRMEWAICETSTPPEYYRESFFRQLFPAARTARFIDLFTQRKEEETGIVDWRFGAPIKTENNAVALADAESDVLALGDAAPSPARSAVRPRYNETLSTIRACASTYTSSQLTPIRINPRALNEDNYATEDLYMQAFKLHSRPFSYGDAVTNWSMQIQEEKAARPLSKVAGLERWHAINQKDPEIRYCQANCMVETWMLHPRQANVTIGEGPGIREILKYLDSVGEGLNKYTHAYLKALLLKRKILTAYYDSFGNNGGPIEYRDIDGKIKQRPDTFYASIYATQVCKEILEFVRQKPAEMSFLEKHYQKPPVWVATYRNCELPNESVLGIEAETLIALGDFYSGNGDYASALMLYEKARTKIAAKDKVAWWLDYEIDLNIAVEIGVARAEGLSAGREIGVLDRAVGTLAKFASKEKRIQGGYRIKAKLHLAELLAEYIKKFIGKGVTREEAVKRAKVAYTICRELENSALARQAKDLMKSIKDSVDALVAGKKPNK